VPVVINPLPDPLPSKDAVRPLHDDLKARVGSSVSGWSRYIAAILHTDERVLAGTGASSVRVLDANGKAHSLGTKGGKVFFVTSERMVYCQGAWIEWPFEDVAGIDPIRFGRLHLTMKDGSKADVTLSAFLLKRARLRAMSDVVQRELQATR
jgi:hypothetical protein